MQNNLSRDERREYAGWLRLAANIAFSIAALKAGSGLLPSNQNDDRDLRSAAGFAALSMGLQNLRRGIAPQPGQS